MALLRTWSTTAANNNTAAPDGAPEGMAPSGVNDTIREIMAQVRARIEGAQWFSPGDDTRTSTIRKDGSTISLSGSVTATYHIGRRIRTEDSVGTLYGTITDVTFSGGTQVSVRLDSGSFTGTITVVEIGVLTASNASTPGDITKSGQMLQMFNLDIRDTGGTMQHRISVTGDIGTAANAENIKKITAADNNLQNTPTGADGSTAMAFGGKISSASTNIFILDVAEQVAAANNIALCSVTYNDLGTAVIARPFFTSRNVNGVTRFRLEIAFTNATSGAAFALTAANFTDNTQIGVDIFAWLR